MHLAKPRHNFRRYGKILPTTDDCSDPDHWIELVEIYRLTAKKKMSQNFSPHLTSTPRRPPRRPRKWAHALHAACLGSALDDRLGAPQARKISAAQRRWHHMNAFGSQMPESASLDSTAAASTAAWSSSREMRERRTTSSRVSSTGGSKRPAEDAVGRQLARRADGRKWV